MAEGFSAKEIAVALSLSASAVTHRIRRLRRRLQARNDNHVVAKYVQATVTALYTKEQAA